eukprot:CAMPEP_0116845562 /NCGR_PEP_ID=MMETSP0418-20121206/13337_1 /TAXON_ID=1158023 /ORGANISM="Astrosyne radiata, Strain 13vi08-1A" /LENGTH=73 /DNA_ID=CAMNT_0004476689 /DNA_START=123 /DNA_END=344 /DNA_ORIENTATION=+
MGLQTVEYEESCLPQLVTTTKGHLTTTTTGGDDDNDNSNRLEQFLYSRLSPEERAVADAHGGIRILLMQKASC